MPSTASQVRLIVFKAVSESLATRLVGAVNLVSTSVEQPTNVNKSVENKIKDTFLILTSFSFLIFF